VKRAVQDPTACEHTRNAAVNLPDMGTGKRGNAHPFIWCRECGSIWLPRLPAFAEAFARHERRPGGVPFNNGVEGVWVLPGELSVVVVS